ncbi:MFS transporter [Dactylosporangium aurantiacum]|uniref:MFS transporter n=1 Tax=Dactylosporangium aurantiacum TaxID=35754 RepID=A0A9Q9I8I6_9ACTN|nr:MFS transporter [Dactylosporangium aurantiacum]MDG6110081.1 MFS transporter [Dactylosporangium aurantiacum]UWZ51332.1 MFS transporter [Dactylosporangium aurantiacum]
MRKWLPLLAVSLSTFMLLVDLTIVSIAAPDLARELHSSFAALQWTVDLYVLVLAALLMAAGSLSDRLGHRRVFIAGLVVFAAASLACGLAAGTGTLIAARGVQGAGAAAMYATNAALLGVVYTGRDRSVAFGVWGAANGAAAAAGPILGGFLTEHVGWRSIFLVNLPVAVIAAVLARLAVPGGRGTATGRVDVPGVAVFTAAASLVVYGLIRAGDTGWSDPVTAGVLAAGAAAAAGFVLVERRRADPMLDLSLLRRPSFAVLMAGAAALTAAAFANLVFVSLWAQSVLGLGAMAAGLVLAPMAVVAFVVAGVGGRLLHTVAPRYSIGCGLLLVAAGTALCMLVGPDSGWAALMPGLCVTGVGVGLSTPVLASASLAAAPPDRAGMASGASNTCRQLGYALALPVFATVVTARAGQVLGDDAAARRLTGGGYRDLLGQVPAGALRAAYAAGLDRVFLVSAVIAGVAGVAVLALLRPPAPARLSPRPAEPAHVRFTPGTTH